MTRNNWSFNECYKCLLKAFVLYRMNVSQMITLQVESKRIYVLCQFGDFGCGDGGWTPVMKIDGNNVCLLSTLTSYSHKCYVIVSLNNIYLSNINNVIIITREIITEHMSQAISYRNFYFSFFFRKPFITTRVSGATKMTTTLLEGRLGLT